MDNTKYYQQVEIFEFNRMKSEFNMTIETSTVYRFVNMYMLCIEDDEAIKEIMLTENEIEELREIFVPKTSNPMFVYFEYNAIKDVNEGRLEAGIAKELVEATKSQFEEDNYIQLIRQDIGKIRYRTLSAPEMHSCCCFTNDSSFTIYKMPDEWFWIKTTPMKVWRSPSGSLLSSRDYVYFKCDGFFGLKKLLQNVKIL